MSQIEQFFGNDLSLTPQGTIPLSDGDALTQQAIIRRLLANPGTYFWEPTYGAGIGRFIGETLNPNNFDYIQNVITAQMLLENTISQNPKPQISFTNLGNGILQCNISYTSAITGNQINFNFPLN
jgi:hypothetical protein